MKEKIAKRIVCMAERAAYKSVGKSIPTGMHEIKPPKELLDKKRSMKR